MFDLLMGWMWPGALSSRVQRGRGGPQPGGCLGGARSGAAEVRRRRLRRRQTSCGWSDRSARRRGHRPPSRVGQVGERSHAGDVDPQRSELVGGGVELHRPGVDPVAVKNILVHCLLRALGHAAIGVRQNQNPVDLEQERGKGQGTQDVLGDASPGVTQILASPIVRPTASNGSTREWSRVTMASPWAARPDRPVGVKPRRTRRWRPRRCP